jgi:large subunit ribosomal protein L24
VFPKTSAVLVEGLNLTTVYLRPSQQNPKGGITKVEGKMYVSNLALVCPQTSKPTRIGYQYLADGTKQRLSKKSNEII